MTLRAEWIADEGRWRELEPAWDDLVLRSAAPSIYATWDFLEATWTHFARPLGDSLAVVALFDGRDLQAVAPFRVSRRRKLGLPVRRLAKLAAWESDRVPPLVCAGAEPECAQALIECLEMHARRWDWIDLDELDPDVPVVRQLSEWAGDASRCLRARLEPEPPSPWVDLSLGWEAVEQGFGRHRRKELRKYQRNLGEAGEWRLEIEEGAAIPNALTSYLDVESRSWKSEAGKGIARNERTLAFYRELLPRLARRGRVSVGFLRQGDRRIAAMIEYSLCTSVWGVQKAYDANAARFAPGNILAVMAFERRAKQAVRSYELQGLYLDDKGHWTDLAHPRTRLRIHQLRSWRHRLLFLRES
jgi:CelD/BcsL family acetyltransferase involved in cellulose biosynthesis